MFNAEESLKHLQEMRLKVVLMKDGRTEEGLRPLEAKENSQANFLKNIQKELDA